MSETTLELRKETFINADLVIGMIVSAGIVVLCFTTLGRDPFFIVIALASVMLPLAWCKFARSVTVDFSNRRVNSIGLISLYRQSFSFDQLEYVRCPKGIGFGGGECFNLVLRRHGAMLPLIFEARSQSEQAQAKRLLRALRVAIPDKVRDSEL